MSNNGSNIVMGFAIIVILGFMGMVTVFITLATLQQQANQMKSSAKKSDSNPLIGMGIFFGIIGCTVLYSGFVYFLDYLELQSNFIKSNRPAWSRKHIIS